MSDEKELVESASKITLDENAPRPRLCHLKKWPHFQGYGFNLHAERSKMGQHIGKVDLNSPAESAGLREGDRIIEVNYVNISNENHQQVVKRIRNGLPADPYAPENGQLNPDEVVLLVLDNEADDYYRNLNLIVKHDFENVLILSTPSSPPNTQAEDISKKNQENVNENKMTTSLDRESVISNKSSNNNNNNLNEDQLNRSNSSNSKTSTRSISSNNDLDSNNNNVVNSSIKKVDSNRETTNTNSPLRTNLNETISNNNSKTLASNTNGRTTEMNGTLSSNKTGSNATNGISLKTDPYQMSAAEFRNYLKTKGRNDPRIVPVDMKQKYELFQNM